MKITAITIFPEYFAPLSLSLIGKAQSDGILSSEVVNLRDFATGTHKSVDDTPYGGGAGMVMRPDVWGNAIDSVAASSDAARIDLIILTPSGRRFTQQDASSLATADHLIFACGRYEGIDARVGGHYETDPRFRVHYISIGDYVLNGGEVAALVVMESVIRLLPGVIGNPDSLVEESHAIEGFLEYPVYTKPPLWRGHPVPEILLSGNHGEIAKWRDLNSRRESPEGESHPRE
ncbi:MAG: tRNA (guanosine(37)-N1)-methyltransferase TrmD [Candidatus Nanopelagicaceae bacterium]|jgi:tRNA (guanine37-N1)-methyltransferase